MGERSLWGCGQVRSRIKSHCASGSKTKYQEDHGDSSSEETRDSVGSGGSGKKNKVGQSRWGVSANNARREKKQGYPPS